MFSEKSRKSEKDPKKLLDQLKKQEEKVKQLELSEGADKVIEVKNKLAWKNILKKAEGEKVKDDRALLKKSIKKIVSIDITMHFYSYCTNAIKNKPKPKYTQ